MKYIQLHASQKLKLFIKILLTSYTSLWLSMLRPFPKKISGIARRKKHNSNTGVINWNLVCQYLCILSIKKLQHSILHTIAAQISWFNSCQMVGYRPTQIWAYQWLEIYSFRQNITIQSMGINDIFGGIQERKCNTVEIKQRARRREKYLTCALPRINW